MTYTKDTIVFNPKPSNSQFQDLTDRVFTRLTVLGYAGKQRQLSQWWCECICGKISLVVSGKLNNGTTKSCGCLGRELLDAHRITTHGESIGNVITPELRAFRQAKRRCTDPNNPKYPKYGGRGIEFRFDSYEEFLTEVGRRPSSKHSINRKDNDGHYEKGNLEWATADVQMRNRTNTRNLTFQGKTQCLADWATETGQQRLTLANRLKNGWCVECTLTLGYYGACPHR